MVFADPRKRMYSMYPYIHTLVSAPKFGEDTPVDRCMCIDTYSFTLPGVNVESQGLHSRARVQNGFEAKIAENNPGLKGLF